ncbi:hypothetical protein HUU62_05320 [Rhodoferax sp. 4810]|uniref:Uncharacterized protein n=1 Tax=Thiospirillum jenense TaxID=1653858 RepID=A0A839H5J4_9GAMM|nr:hypothetical protein [Thiospirillum jenense]MBB1073830.1 hypothetical protein [Rhodoferax jenense]MBB1125215.1 hypothetical protein [Thiospirillum jenense]
MNDNTAMRYWIRLLAGGLCLFVVSSHANVILITAYSDLYESVDYRQVVIYQNWFDRIGTLIATIRRVQDMDHTTVAVTIELPPVTAIEQININDVFISMKGLTPFRETSYVVTSPYLENTWIYVFAFDRLWDSESLLPDLPDFFKGPRRNIHPHRYGYVLNNKYVTKKKVPFRYNENSVFYMPLENTYMFTAWTPQLTPVKKEKAMPIDYSNPFFNLLTRIRNFFYQPWIDKRNKYDD